MSLKRAPDDGIEERPVQRARLLLYGGGVETTPLSLDDINDHCILEIFKCLSVDDLNSIAAFLSKRFNELRNHDSLDQTRTGTIVCTENTTLESISDAFVAQEWNQVFTGNRTHLKVLGLERMPRLQVIPVRSQERMLPNVTSLDMSFDPLAENRNIQCENNVSVFVWMLPNLEEIDLSYMTLGGERDDVVLGRMSAFCSVSHFKCPKIIWNGSQRDATLDFSWLVCRITELHLDDSLLGSILDAAATRRAYSDSAGTRYMLSRLTNIVSLSFKNATFFEFGSDSPRAFPVTQEMLINMVRHHPTLRWLRSDLTEENIAMLKRERPEITFVSE